MNSRLVIYKASAGSGKTFTLAANYISHLLVNPGAYRHLLAVTFTNKATGEMKERILSQLYGISRGLEESDSYLAKARELLAEAGCREDIRHRPLTEDTLRENAAEALTSILHNYSFFRIETIDTFMLSILRGLAKELELGQGMEIELDTKRACREGVHDFIEQLVPRSKEMNAVVDYIKDAIDNERHWNVTNDLTQFAAHLHGEAFMRHADELEQLLAKESFTPGNLRQTLWARVQVARQHVADRVDEFFALCDGRGIGRDDIRGKSRSPYAFYEKLRELTGGRGSTGSKWPNITATLQGYAADADCWVDSKQRTPASAAVAEVSPRLCSLLNDTLEPYRHWKQTYITASLATKNLYQLQLLGGIDAKIKERCRRENRFLLADTCQMLMKMASGPADTAFIYEKTGTQIDHILIDEFQDTSGMQWDNFRPLLTENASRGKQGLIVGDVKQAIYRFRGSNADIMARRVEEDMQMAGPHTVTLGVNRRSRRGIVEFNNRFFPRLVGTLGEMDDKFKVSHYADVRQEWLPGNDGGEVRIVTPGSRFMVHGSWLAAPSTPSLQTLNHEPLTLNHEPLTMNREPLIVAEQVKELLDKGLQPADIAILTRRNKEIGMLAEWFEAHPEALAPHKVRLVSGEAFKLESSDAVRLLVGAMRWVNDAEDVVSLVQVGIGWHGLVKRDGLTVPDMLALRERHYGLPDAFAAGHDALSALPLCELAHTLYDVLEMGRMEGQAAWMQSFFDAVQHFAAEKSGSLDDFLKEWDETLREKAIPSGDADGIACMTIHKAKGLEWDSVIVLCTNWTFESQNKKPVLWVETKPEDYEGLTVLPIRRAKDMQESDFAMQYDEETRQIWMDNLNLLYVAFTRPKSNLIVIREETKKETSTPTTINDFIEIGSSGVQECRSSDDSQGKLHAGHNFVNGQWKMDNGKLIINYQLSIINCAKGALIPNCSKSAKRSSSPNPLLPHAEALSVGFHTAPVRLPFRQSNSSKLYISRGDDSPMSKFIERGNLLHEVFAHIGTAADAPRAIDGLFTRGIINAAERDEIAHTVSEALRQPEVSDWFSGRYELFNECTILTAEEGMVRQRRPDRVMRSEDKTIVVDFKFGQPLPGHRHQVANYMHLLRQMGFDGVEGYLWYVPLHQIVHV